MTTTPFPKAQSTLNAEHALLLTAVEGRAKHILADADRGLWPAERLREFLDYLHLEVLRQIADEEWLLFRHSHHAPQSLAPLHEDHLGLRRLIDDLSDAAVSPAESRSPAYLAERTRELLAKLKAHIQAEERVLGTDNDIPSMSALGRIPHSWYPLTEGPTIDLDELPGPRGVDAALGRLLRLRAHEEVEVRTSSDPYPIWRRLAAADPGGYGFTYLQTGPPQWRVNISRR